MYYTISPSPNSKPGKGIPINPIINPSVYNVCIHVQKILIIWKLFCGQYNDWPDAKANALKSTIKYL